MMAAARRIVKVGGSLLEDAQLPTRLKAWLAGQPQQATLLLAGGGAIVDVLRRADEVHNLGQALSHRLSIQAMSITAGILASWFPEAQVARSWQACNAAGDADAGTVQDSFALARLTIIDPSFLAAAATDPDSPELPESWDVTSDSIAAHLAVRLRAEELVLLKSCSPPSPDFQQACRAGYVDRHFPHAAGGLQVRAVNLRDESFPETSWNEIVSHRCG